MGRLRTRFSTRFARAVVYGLLALGMPGFVLPAAALEYRSTIDAATILYDGPSLKSQKVFVVGREYPFEVVVSLEGWAKVRDMAGAPLAWVERKALSDKRMVVVKSGTADVLAAADPGARTVFRVEQHVLLELVEPPVSGWVKVRHRDGQTGFISIAQVWGL
jgi:SH3-like domain-containing protein